MLNKKINIMKLFNCKDKHEYGFLTDCERKGLLVIIILAIVAAVLVGIYK